MTGHRRIPSKIKLRLLASCFKRAHDRAKFDYLIIALLSLWPDDIDIEAIEVFQNSHLEGTDLKSCSF